MIILLRSILGILIIIGGVAFFYFLKVRRELNQGTTNSNSFQFFSLINNLGASAAFWGASLLVGFFGMGLIFGSQVMLLNNEPRDYSKQFYLKKRPLTRKIKTIDEWVPVIGVQVAFNNHLNKSFLCSAKVQLKNATDQTIRGSVVFYLAEHIDSPTESKEGSIFHCFIGQDEGEPFSIPPRSSIPIVLESILDFDRDNCDEPPKGQRAVIFGIKKDTNQFETIEIVEQSTQLLILPEERMFLQ